MKKILFVLFSIFLSNYSCKKEIKKPNIVYPNNESEIKSDIEFYLTNGNQSALLQKQNISLLFGNHANNYPTIEVDSSKTYQSIDGFGFMLTGASAELINKMEAKSKEKLLQELFGNDSNGIAVSYLRISIGASDLSTSVYSYNDITDTKDENLEKFSINPEKKDMIPLLKEILAINSKIKIMATPWSAPLWMKDNRSTIGGSLKPEYYEVYAQYFVKYILAMKAEGIDIEAITPQNEPLNPKNNPSMYMSADQQANFIGNNLGPAFQKTNIKTKIIAYDHNCDEPNYPISVLNNVKAKRFVDGSAFHLYGGNINAMGTVHHTFPDKNVYFTEQYTSSKGEFSGDLKWHLRNVVIGSLRNWSRTVIEWNLANDPLYQLHTPGGCTECKGALTINGNEFSRNVSYYIIAQASKFVAPNSIRIESNNSGNLQTVAFKRPDNKIVLIAENDGNEPITFNIKYNGKWTTTSLQGGSVGTFMW